MSRGGERSVAEVILLLRAEVIMCRMSSSDGVWLVRVWEGIAEVGLVKMDSFVSRGG